MEKRITRIFKSRQIKGSKPGTGRWKVKIVPISSTYRNTIILLLIYCFLAPKNNPGWYLPEDDGTGAVAVQRRNMPLLKDKSDVFLLNQKAKVGGTFVYQQQATNDTSRFKIIH